jgi:hypothetical protein
VMPKYIWVCIFSTEVHASARSLSIGMSARTPPHGRARRRARTRWVLGPPIAAETCARTGWRRTKPCEAQRADPTDVLLIAPPGPGAGLLCAPGWQWMLANAR